MRIDTSKVNLSKVQEFYNVFIKDGFPNKKKEDLKFTDLDKILNSHFKNLEPLREKGKHKKEKNLKFEHYPIYTLNGELLDDTFQSGNEKNAESGIFINKINNNEDHPIYSEASSDKDRELISNNSKKDQMLSINLALIDRGINLKITKSYEKPIVIYNFFDNNLQNKIINNANQIQIKNSKATIIEYNIDKSNSNYFKNTFQKISLDESNLDYYVINSRESKALHYSKNIIEINNQKSKKASKFVNYLFCSGIKFRKDDYNIILSGKESIAKVYSSAILKNNDHHEIKTKMYHKEPYCNSYQKIKNILAHNSKGIFQGKVLVSDQAQKTDAYQLSKGLILDDKAEFNTKPELEIYADDVKCSHGSTSGNVDKDAIFYLMTRGLSKKDATKLIIRGFLSDITSEIKNKDIYQLIETHLENNLIYEN